MASSDDSAKKKETEKDKSSKDISKPFEKIRKRDGRIIVYNLKKIEDVIERASKSIGLDLDFKDIALKVEKKLVKEHEHKSGARIPDVEEIQDFVEEVLIEAGHRTLARSFMLYREQKSIERSAKNALIGKKVTTQLSLNALNLLKERYLLKDEKSNWYETPEEMFERIASFIAKAELVYSKDDAFEKKWKNRFKRIMRNLDFLPNSSCMMNSGTEHPQLASSIAIPISDSLEGIYKGLYDAAASQQEGAGTGFDFSKLRQKGSRVKGRLGAASGPLKFLKLYNDSANTILQSGRRMGANMALIDVHHPDVLDFITAKTHDNTLENFNISILLDDVFIKAVVMDEDYELIDPVTKEVVRKMNAKQVFDILVATAWNQADPGVMFKERILQDNPLPDYKFFGTSPCAEMILGKYEQGFLGSINLANFVGADGEIDFRRLKEVIHIGVRFLDDAIDVSDYPLLPAEKRMKATRKIGLGVMGLAHMLVQMNVSYDSNKALEVVDKLMSFIKEEAENASEILAKERGVFSVYNKSIFSKDSKWFKGGKVKKLRHASLLAISPTGSRSMIAETSSGIEPLFALSYVKRALGGREFHYLDPYLRNKLIGEGIFSDELVEKISNFGLQNLEEVPEFIKKIFVTAYDISSDWQVKMQSVVQKYVDNAVSKTVNLPNDASLLDVENVFLLAYNLSCKGCTIYRDGSKSNQVYTMNNIINSRKKEDSKNIRKELREQFLNNTTLTEFDK